MRDGEVDFSNIELTKAIVSSHIKCRYCSKNVESETDNGVIVELIYHLHEEHKEQQRINKWDLLP